jgi:hypothetical protein
MTTKMIFSVKLLNKKVIDNFLRFPERTQESEFVCGRYDQNTELDRDKSEQPSMVGKCGDGPEKVWKVANVYKLHQSEQVLSQG